MKKTIGFAMLCMGAGMLIMFFLAENVVTFIVTAVLVIAGLKLYL